uniref:Uncharacterized protein n=1 Tax=Panagrolaimus sp. JU765 TaxID=591449 RepID=A0AC34QUM1_9BILA
MLTYESYKEILTTSLQGFISQIGGQFGLFLGLSVITIVQFCFSMTKIGIKKAKKTYDDVDPFFKHLLENFEKENSNKFSNGDAIKEKPKELNLSDISV